MARQPSFLKRQNLSFGGSLLKKSHAKTARPLDSRSPIHLVMRSEKATGARSMRHPRHFGPVVQLFEATAAKYGVKVYRFANVGNHLHAVIRLHSRALWGAFIRELSGRLAQLLQGLKGQAPAPGKFWDQRPFTRVAHWGKDYAQLAEYVLLNAKEADGYVTRAEERTMRALRRRFADPA